MADLRRVSRTPFDPEMPRIGSEDLSGNPSSCASGRAAGTAMTIGAGATVAMAQILGPAAK